MYDEVLKFGAMIVDALRTYKHPGNTSQHNTAVTPRQALLSHPSPTPIPMQH